MEALQFQAHQPITKQLGSAAHIMNEEELKTHRRILLVDDNAAIHEDFRKILSPPPQQLVDLDHAETALFGKTETYLRKVVYRIDSAYQGQEGLALIEKAINEGEPYAMAFVDVRMPPGWDGVETVEHIWKVYPELQVVFCTAYSDYSFDDMIARLGETDRLLILKKPFDSIEVLQLAHSTTEKWRLYRQAQAKMSDLEKMVQARTVRLQELNNRLSLEIQRANDLARQAMQGSAAKSEFLAMMGHEIRTPIHGIMGMTDLLMETPLAKDQREYAQTARQNADALLSILNDILDFSKLDTGKFKLDEAIFETRSMALAIVNILSRTAEKKGLALDLAIADDVPESVLGDPQRFRQVLLNLLSNAIKFTHTGSVSLQISCKELSTHTVHLNCAVKDTGIGMSPDVQAKLFQPFYQGDSSLSRNFEGTGLGLAICQRLAALMGGNIAVESAEGKGSTFNFTLPLPIAPPDLLPPSKSGNAAQPPKPPRVLIVDDNSVHQKVALLQLRKLGCQVELASDGIEAVSSWQRNRPDLILMDSELPAMDGCAAARKIRDLEREWNQPPVRIVALTPGSELSDHKAFHEAGVTDFLSTPISLPELKQTVSRHLGQFFSNVQNEFPEAS